jgi:hypothetical protein
LPDAGEALGTAAKVLLTPLTELGVSGAAAVVSGAAAIVGGEGIFHSVGGEVVERGLESASHSHSKHPATPATHPAQPQVLAPSTAPISASTSIPTPPAKAQFPTPAVDKPSALDIQIQQQRKAQAAQAKQEEAEQKKQMAAWKTLRTDQGRLDNFSAGHILSGSDLETFRQGLTPQQRQAVQAQATARNDQLTQLAKEADTPLSRDELQQQQQQLEQRVLYEQYTPAREIYHFESLFLNGYTPQKMQAVRGYFDEVFAGTYSKAIPADKRTAIESSADAKYSNETNLKADRESPLWKTLRNIEASEKYPDLWDGFRNDLSAAGQTGVLKTMTNPNDPSLGSNALNRPSQSQPLNRSRLTQPETFPTGVGQQPQQPVGGGFDNAVNPELTKQQEGFPTNQPVDGVTNVHQNKGELNPADRIQHEEYLRSLRQQMAKPHVEDARLDKLLNKIYRKDAEIGSGSTADAIRHERLVGEPVKGVWHSQKGEESVRSLETWLKNNPTASSGDRAAAENVIKDLKDSLSLPPKGN